MGSFSCVLRVWRDAPKYARFLGWRTTGPVRDLGFDELKFLYRTVHEVLFSTNSLGCIDVMLRRLEGEWDGYLIFYGTDQVYRFQSEPRVGTFLDVCIATTLETVRERLNDAPR